MPSRALERARAWLDQEIEEPGLLRFRCVFGLVWLAYDLCDLLGSGTATMGFWPAGVLGAPAFLCVLQVGLIACEAAMFLGSWAVAAPLSAVVLRGVEAWAFLRLNDFYYFIVVALLLSQVPPGRAWALTEPRAERVALQRDSQSKRVPDRHPLTPRTARERAVRSVRGSVDAHALGWAWSQRGLARVPRWVCDALRWQAAWIYLATGALKLNPAWLSGGHLYVRQAYLAAVLRWPYPAPLAHALSHLTVDAGLAWVAASWEILLGVLLVAGRPAAAIAGLAVAIHTFGALAMNVWFFGASMVAQVVLFLPRGRGGARREASF